MATTLFKLFIILLLLMILVSLASGVVFLVKDDSKSTRVVKSLTFRISLSVLLFISLFVGHHFGWIEPHGLVTLNGFVINKKAP